MRHSHSRLFRAPGRVNLIGEHTDYNEGLVLPINTALYTRVCAEPRSDDCIHVYSANADESDRFDLPDLQPGDGPPWTRYVRGVAAELAKAGNGIRGATLKILGDIPIGGGLGSSASLELAVAVALLELSRQKYAPRDIATLCQAAEQNFAGVNCGIMDQYSVACGESGKAMLLDCRSLETGFVDIPDALRFVITDSGVRHQLSDGGYNDRAHDCKTAVAALQKMDHAIKALRDVSLSMLEAARGKLGDRLFSRSRHVVSEIQRVRDTVVALDAGDVEMMGALVSGSHRSLRDDFGVSCDEVESLVEIADRCDGVLGSRMVGAGFGGCVLSVLRSDAVGEVTTEIGRKYGAILGRSPWIHVLRPAASAMEVREQ